MRIVCVWVLLSTDRTRASGDGTRGAYGDFNFDLGQLAQHELELGWPGAGSSHGPWAGEWASGVGEGLLRRMAMAWWRVGLGLLRARARGRGGEEEGDWVGVGGLGVGLAGVISAAWASRIWGLDFSRSASGDGARDGDPDPGAGDW